MAGVYTKKQFFLQSMQLKFVNVALSNAFKIIKSLQTFITAIQSLAWGGTKLINHFCLF
jgi:hypothetical protein